MGNYLFARNGKRELYQFLVLLRISYIAAAVNGLLHERNSWSRKASKCSVPVEETGGILRELRPEEIYYSIEEDLGSTAFPYFINI